MTYKYDYAIFIGRFQPYHSGHHYVTRKALDLAQNLIFLIGSHDKPRDFRNPFTSSERIEIIKAGLYNENIIRPGLFDRVHFAPQVDYPYNDEKWIAAVQAAVSAICYRTFVPDPIKICIIGYDKDHSSYYLKKFPQWDLIEVDKVVDHITGESLDATKFRKEIFNYELKVPLGFKSFSGSISDAHKYKTFEIAEPIKTQMQSEYQYIEEYQNIWGKGPFVTVDSVVTQSGHILLIERGAEYGEGQWALPGGFINPHEKLLEAAIRELREETKLKVPAPVLVGSIARQQTFDHPHRSNRARIISQAYHFRLNDMAEGLPKVKGSDDARKAWWCSFEEFAKSRHRFFEDHYDLVSYLTGVGL